jgi:hypothetical protein
VTFSEYTDQQLYLQKIELPIVVKSGIFYRINSCCNREGQPYETALHFGKSCTGRWNDPLNQYGVLYVGVDAHVAFIESYGRTEDRREIQRQERERLNLGRLTVTTEELSKKFLVEITSSRELRFVEVDGSSLVKIGTDANLVSGSHAISRPWARAFYEHPAQVDGICYRSRHDNSRFCYAIFDRVTRDTLTENKRGTLIQQPQELLDDIIVNTYGGQIVDNQPVRVNPDDVDDSGK